MKLLLAGSGIVSLVACSDDDRRERERRDAEDPSLPDPAGLVLGEPVGACESPRGPEGALFERQLLPDEANPVGERWLVGGGMVVADLTNDGRTDLFLPGPGWPALWAQGEDRTFDEVSRSWFAPEVPFLGSIGGSVADYDADGDLDLFVTQYGIPDLLLRNDGDHYEDVTAAAGFTGEWRSVSASWADYDRDGWLDLVVGAYSKAQPTVLWRNRGDGTFEDRTDLFPPEVAAGFTFMTAWADLEGDGYPDLFVANDFWKNQACLLLANRAGRFEIDGTAGYHPGFHGMGLTLADFDHDRVPDVVETTFRQVSLLSSAPLGDTMQGVLYVDAGPANGFRADPDEAGQVFGWGVDAGDLDNDGDQDVIATFGYWDTHQGNPPEQADSVWLWSEGVGFERQADSDWGEDRGALLVDVDHDGWLDLVKRTLAGDDPVDFGRCEAGRHWLEVDLRDEAGPNTRGIGATIAIEVDGQEDVRFVHSGSSSIFSGGPPSVHFGLGEAEAVDRLEVTWPDGRVSTFLDVPGDRAVTVLAP